MVQKKLENLIKKILPVNRYLHWKICAGTGMRLDYSSNKDGIGILETIFVQREYADYFPFQQSATIVDVGAHYGFFSFFAALNTAKDSRILALEPSRENFDVLQKNLGQNAFSNIESFPLALDGQSGERNFYGGPSYNHSFFGKSTNRAYSVPTLSLKAFIHQYKLEQIDFLKLDCEGAEYPILLTAEAPELALIQTISLEFHDLPRQGYTSLQLIRHLEKHDFQIVKYHHDSDYSFGNLNFGKIIATKGG